MDTKNIIASILETTERLQEHYWQRVDQGDAKASAGIESCCEINLKLLGIVTKPDIILAGAEPEKSVQTQKSLDLSRLTDQALTEILGLLQEPANNKNQQVNDPQ